MRAAPETGSSTPTCENAIARILAGRWGRQTCGELTCLECGRLSLVGEVGAAISALEWPRLEHDAFVITLHGIDRDAWPEEVGELCSPVERGLGRLHDRYYRFDAWSTIEQSAEGVANMHALTSGRTPKRRAVDVALEEARDLGLVPVVSYETLEYPRSLAPYAAKIGLYSLVASGPADSQLAIGYMLKLGRGSWACHTPGFFGGLDEPWTPAQRRSRGLRRARGILDWAESYRAFGDKLPPRLVAQLHRPPWPSADDAQPLSDADEESVLDDEGIRFMLDGLDGEGLGL